MRGQPAEFVHHEPGRYRVPPHWSGGYTSIFEIQQRQKAAAM